MRIRKACLVLVLCTVIAVDTYGQSSETIVKLPSDIEFKAPVKPGGPAVAVLYGNPTMPGLYVTRVKFQPGFKILPHWHPEERTVVVLSGTFYFAVGGQWVEGKLKAYPPGTFYSEPPKTAASALRLLAVPSSFRSSAAAQREC